MLGPSWDGWDGVNCGLPFVPPNYPHKARSPVSQLLGEIVHFLLLGGTGLFFSTGFLFHWQLPRAAGEAAWDVLCVDEPSCGPSRQWDVLGCVTRAEREQQVLQTHPSALGAPLLPTRNHRMV